MRHTVSPDECLHVCDFSKRYVSADKYHDGFKRGIQYARMKRYLESVMSDQLLLKAQRIDSERTECLIDLKRFHCRYEYPGYCDMKCAAELKFGMSRLSEHHGKKQGWEYHEGWKFDNRSEWGIQYETEARELYLERILTMIRNHLKY